jgi:nucleoside-diphosphate-sugar epimerase
MRIFVTGGTGFIGSHFIKAALEAGHHVVALRRPGSKTRIPLGKQPDWLDGELADVDGNHLADIDVLVHLAAQGVSPQKTDWNIAFEVNVRQSISLLATAVEAGVVRSVLCGSCFEFGRAAERYDKIPADAPLEPVGPYAASKAAFSMAAEALARQSSGTFALLRPFNIYGEGQHSSNFWPSLRDAARSGEDFKMTPGDQIRDFQSVRDVALEFLHQAERVTTTCPSFEKKNIGSGKPVSLADFAANWWRHWRAKGSLKIGDLPHRKDEIMRFVPEIS